MEKERLSAFTDAVLAIIMTILVLELDKPTEPTIQAFIRLKESFISYALSFFWLGTMWVELHQEWHEVKKISNAVVWWSIVLLFFASLVPYATSLVYKYFMDPVIQGFYGIIIIMISIMNVGLRHSLKKVDPTDIEMLNIVEHANKILYIDISVKVIGFIIATTIYPPAMMISVLITLIIFVMTHQVLLFWRL